MPSSRPNTIPTVINVVRQLKPSSILDVGVGFGKWGHLFREYTDINEAERDPRRYQRRNWRLRIDGIEGHVDYVTPMHRFLYNQIHVGNACALIKTLSRYDLIFMGDVIEHLEKAAGMRLLRDALKRAGKAVIVTTPKYETGQTDLCANELERHRSLWSAEDFAQFEGATVKTVDRATLLAVILKPGLPVPTCAPPMPMRSSVARHFGKCREELTRLISTDTPFIVVDDGQLYGILPHRRTIPFLEKNGEYWGPPADDATAIRELERLRDFGARYIVFTWPALWWLKHYVKFKSYLEFRFDRTHESSHLVVFDLKK